MRRLPRSAITFLAASLTLGPFSAPAAAATCKGAPGASALDQYCESIPAADGSTTSSGDPGQSNVPQSTASTLAQSGADGAGVARLAASGSKAAGTSTSKSGAGVRASRSDAPQKPSGNVLAATSSAAGAGPLAHSGVIWLLIAIALAGALAMAARAAGGSRGAA